jgi:hypothetical protein
MRHTLVATMALVLALAAGARAQKQLTLVATITDPAGGAIETVDAKDVEVTEDGKPAPVVKVEAVNRIPRVHLLIDNGVGIPADMQADLRRGVKGFIDALPQGIEVSIVTTAPQPRFLERGSSDRAKIQKGVELLAPDTGSGRFVESLVEAMDRIDKDKQDSNNVILSVASTSGDLRVNDGDIKKINAHVRKGRTKVHVVIFAGRVNSSLGGGDAQLNIGEVVANNTQGRFEKINSSSALATLLPEIGANVAATMGKGARQFRFTVDRPAGASGQLGKMTLGIIGKLVAAVSVE